MMKKNIRLLSSISIAAVLLTSVIACSQERSSTAAPLGTYVREDFYSSGNLVAEFFPENKVLLWNSSGTMWDYQMVDNGDGLTRLALEDSSNAQPLVLVQRGDRLLLLDEGAYEGFLLSKVKGSDLQKVEAMKNQAAQEQGRVFTGSLNRGQREFYRNNSSFTNQIEDFGLGIEAETDSHSYSIKKSSRLAFNMAQSKKEDVSSYIGLVKTDDSGYISFITCTVDDSSIQVAELVERYESRVADDHNAALFCPEVSSES